MSKSERIIYIILSVAIFIYLAIRSIYAGTLNDEAFTFFMYIHTGDFLPFVSSTHYSANNHILNSALSWLAYKVFGPTEWALRLPNLLSFIMYMWFAYLIGKQLSKSYLRYLFWSLLICAHYYLEFFAYSRGYGLGMAFLIGSVYFLMKAEKQLGSINNLFLGLTFIFLATLANLNLLISFLIWLAFAAKILYFKHRWNKSIVLFITTCIGFTWFLISWSLQLQSKNQFSFGKSTLTTTYNSLIEFFTGASSPNTLMSWIYIIPITFVTISGAYRFVKNQSIKTLWHLFFYIFFVLNVLGSIILHYLLGVNYPLERTGFHWFFFLAGAIPFLIDQFKNRLKAILATLLFLSFFPIFSFSIKSLSIYSSSNPEWARQQLSDEFFDITQELNTEKEFPLSMYAPESFYTLNMAFKSLKHRDSINVCNAFPRKSHVYSSDLLIIDTARYPDCIPKYQELHYDPHSQMALMRRAPLLQRYFVYDTITKTSDYNTKEFTVLADFNQVDHSVKHPYRIDCHLKLTSSENPLKSLLTFEVRDSTLQTISYEQICLDYMHTSFSDGYSQKISYLIDPLPPNAYSVRCLIWNFEKKPLRIDKAKVSLFELRDNSKG